MSLAFTGISTVLALSGPIADQWPPDAGALERELPQGSHYAAAYGATSPAFVVVFFSRTLSDGRVGWYALRREMGGPEAGTTLWSSGSDCPALYAALDWLSDLAPPDIAINGLRRLPEGSRPYEMRPRRGPVADGPTYWVSGSGWGPDQSLVQLSMTSTGGYVADWGEATTRHLSTCWRPERPF